jgi:hypothetical protein
METLMKRIFGMYVAVGLGPWIDVSGSFSGLAVEAAEELGVAGRAQ